MSEELTSAVPQRFLGINKSVLSELVSRGIIKRREKRGTYLLEASVASISAIWPLAMRRRRGSG